MNLLSQGEFDHWCFGYNRHVSFHSGVPANLPNTALSTNGGTISVSDSTGMLLFYSDGATIYNRNNAQMLNGTGLGAPSSSMINNAIVIQTPADDSLYYFFTTAYYSSSPALRRVAEYSVLDMRLDGGLGGILPGMKKIPLVAGYSAVGSLQGIRHANNKDAWVVMHPMKSDSNFFAAYKVTASGVNVVPVISQSLIRSVATFEPNPMHIRISPDGHHLVCSYSYSMYMDTLEVCYFDAATGQVTPRFLIHPQYQGHHLNCNGVEFSLDSKLIYLAGQYDINHVNIYQYDINAADSAQFVAGMMDVGVASRHHSRPQMASNRKIYFTPDAWDTLQVINNPSVRGTGCNFARAGFPLNPGNHADGFPQFVQKYKAYMHFDVLCDDLTVQFSSDIWPPADSIQWNFGDLPSGVNNTSTLPGPVHVFSDTGSYAVTLIVLHNDLRRDTTVKIVHLGFTPDIDLGPDTTLCNGDTVVFSVPPCSDCTITWKDVTADTVVSTTALFPATHPGIFSVSELLENGCEGRDTVQLSLAPVPLVTPTPPYDTLCSGDTTHIMLASGLPSATYHWTAALTQGNVSGFSPGTGALISQSLSNNLALPGVVTYTITPQAGNCTGPVVNVPVTVLPGDSVGVSIAPSVNPVCEGMPVTFTATAIHGGPNPSFQWKVNATNATNASNETYTYSPVDGDRVSCLVTSSLTRCIRNNPARSDTIVMTAYPRDVLGVTITASAGPVCAGTPVTFTATAINGGPSPAFQWMVNGTTITQATNATYVYTPAGGDAVTCTVTSSLECLVANPVTGLPCFPSILPLPAVSFAPCHDTLTLVSGKPFRLKGGIPLNGTWSGPGVNSVTGFFDPFLAGPGVHIITYLFTNTMGCGSSATGLIRVAEAPAFTCGQNLTDIRDGKSYPTARIGSQCWMTANLDRGTRIPFSQGQYDNCVAEKYCYGNLDDGCTRYGGLYQWDELMNYETENESQGLCPPGWHVPSDGEWATLCDVYYGFGRAGVYLTHPVLSPFNSLSGGVAYLNQTWSFGGFATLEWTSTATGPARALSHGLNQQNYSVALYPAIRSDGFPVRCLQD